jgi:hypothetical protein
MIRPSLVMRYELLWDQRREEFWDLLFQVSADAGIPEIGKVVGASVVADAARAPAELEPLVHALRSDNTSRRETAELVFRHLVGSLTVGARGVVVGPAAGPWCEFLATVTAQ